MADSEHGDRGEQFAFLAYAYLAVIRADCETDAQEVKRARDRLATRIQQLGGSPQDCDAAWELGSAWRLEFGTPNIYLPNVARFMATQPRTARVAFLEDLVCIAAADHVLRISELDVIAELAGRLDFTGEITLGAIRSRGAIRLTDAEGAIEIRIPGVRSDRP